MITVFLPQAQRPAGCKKMLAWCKQFPAVGFGDYYGGVASRLRLFEMKNSGADEDQTPRCVTFSRETDCITIAPSCPAAPVIIEAITKARRPLLITLSAADFSIIGPEGFDPAIIDWAHIVCTGICIFEGQVSEQTVAELSEFCRKHERVLLISTGGNGGGAWVRYFAAMHSPELVHDYLFISGGDSTLADYGAQALAARGNLNAR